ncbi:unnamed protein product [Mytilus coruscus]|uniref:Fucolectin tachylectin-4 pentraxin-1 domain-containing protein n=1 Tax=Mytilus coruscus TaxID=42192 RepID=A0A6J8EAD4_MYTCO|nr:unnamed protein product [Mytilus coruscus]
MASCTEKSSNSNGEKAWLEGVKVVEVFAVIFLFASSIISALTIALRKWPTRTLLLWKLFTAFSGAAGTVIIMGVLIFFKKKAGLSPSQAIATKDGIADWSMIVSSICGVLSIVCSVFIGCKLIMKDSDMDDETDYSKWHENTSDVQILQEVAEGKASTQSSQHGHHEAVHANDGNISTFSHTTTEQSPYWMVDLGRDYNIRQIEIFARRDCCGELIRQLDITAGSSHNLMTRCGFYSGPAQTGYHLAFECTPIINGRYVKIQKNDTTNLALAEVQVMAIVDRIVG